MRLNSIKIIIILVFLVIMAGMLFNVDLPNSSEETTKITMVIKSKYGTKWELISAGAKAAANEYGAELSILAPDYEKDIVSQKNLVLAAEKNNSSGIILAPINDESLSSVVTEVVNSGVPVMNIVSGTTNPDVYSYLLTNYKEVGRLIGSTLVEEVGSDGDIIIVSSEESSNTTQDKLEGLMNYINNETSLNVLDTIYTSGEVLTIERSFINYFNSNKVIGVVALDNATTIGVGKAFEKLDLKIGMVGSNIYENELALIENGYVDQVVDENFFAIGYLAMENSINMARDKGYITNRLISPYIINKQNINDPDIQKIIFPIQ